MIRIKQRQCLFSAGCHMYVVLGISFLSDLSLAIQILIATLKDAVTRWVKFKETLSALPTSSLPELCTDGGFGRGRW